jgi:hypothetical protein
VATHYFAAEGPFTPNEIVGAPDHCGQELFVFASGPILTAGSGDPYHFDIVSATLRPKGKTKVAVKIADGLTKIPAKYGGGELGGYLGPGAGIVIPVRALKPKTTYLASVTIKGNGVTLKDSWSFTTA